MLLARLHGLPINAFPSWPCWWNTPYSLPHAIEQLQRVKTLLPGSQHAFHQACLTTSETLLEALPRLPQTFVHGDSWMQNVVSTPGGQSFIDWESAGRGAAILDLADFLLRSQCEHTGALPQILNERHILAGASGYLLFRLPSAAELDMLVESLRFSVVWGASWLFARLLTQS